MLHETPASVRRIAGLSITDFAQDGNGKTFAILGQSTTSNAPWPISQQIIDAVEALRSHHPRLISPPTKNPNVLLVKDAIEPHGSSSASSSRANAASLTWMRFHGPMPVSYG
jgi:hypothetical protein